MSHLDETKSSPNFARPEHSQLDEQRSRAAVTENLFGTRTAEPAKVGRFILVDSLGRGAMGHVYRAFDPELDRAVAVKVIRQLVDDPAQRERANERLLREARSAAKLAHPNVVMVHEAGRVDDGGVFVAMELVKGRNLREWLETKPSQAQVIDAIAQAGRGLQEAHEHGLVHRDIKPDNILVGDDGRVRVGDFGLAVPRTQSSPADGATSSSADDSPSSVTRRSWAGQVAGTPAYMAPELFLGEAASFASDQFSLCVTAYYALVGIRPFPGETVSELLERMMAGPPRLPSDSGRRLAGSIRKALLRGLSVDPGARWPSVGVLVDQLEARPSRRLAVGLAVLGVAGLTAAATLWPSRQPCEGFDRRASEIWRDGARERVEANLRATAPTYGAQVFVTVDRGIDAYLSDWTTTATEVCRATRVERTRSEPDLELQMRCLDRRIRRARVLVSALEGAKGPAVERAIKAVDALPGLDGCKDLERLAEVDPPPRDPALAAEIDDVRSEVDRMIVRRELGASVEAAADGERLIDRARDTARSALLAEVLLAVGVTQIDAGQLAPARTKLERAYELAVQSGDFDGARAAANRVVEVLARQGETEFAELWLRHAQAWTERDPTSEARESGLIARARLHRTQRAHEKAIAAAREAVNLRRARLGDEDPALLSAETLLGATLNEGSKYDEASVVWANLARKASAVFGPRHPDYAVIRYNQYVVLRRQDDKGPAREAVTEALEIWREAYGGDHLRVAAALNGMAILESSDGRFDVAAEAFEAAAEMKSRLAGPDHPEVGLMLTNAGQARGRMGHHERAIGNFTQALDLFERTVGEDHLDTADARAVLGVAYRRDGQLDEARTQLERAVSVHEALGTTRTESAFALNELGRVHLLLGELQAARASSERARATWKELGDEGAAALEVLISVALEERKIGEAKALLAEQQRLRIDVSALDRADTLLDEAKLAWLERNRALAYEKAAAAERELGAAKVADALEAPRLGALREDLDGWFADHGRG